MNQVEGQQKNLVHAIESLPGSGPLTALDQDLLLLKATSAATLSCLGECLHLLQQSVQQVGQPSHKPGASGETSQQAYLHLQMSTMGGYVCPFPHCLPPMNPSIFPPSIYLSLIQLFRYLFLSTFLPNLGYIFLLPIRDTIACETFN